MEFSFCFCLYPMSKDKHYVNLLFKKLPFIFECVLGNLRWLSVFGFSFKVEKGDRNFSETTLMFLRTTFE
jgi:hypothetical protein